uniref:Metallo-beta-lactamase domain-containing protein n=1 Tax=Plectus sambesii TaxID=2011161 RepID=A0A914WTL6_9BILA
MMFAILILSSAIFITSRAQVTVTSLVEGRLVQTASFPPISTFQASVTLVQDGTNIILIDTPTATDTAAMTQMLNGMQQRNLSPTQVNMVVVTHGHPDHFGQDGSFAAATHYYNNFKYTGPSQFTPLTFDSMGSMQLTPNVQLWQTPGHTPQDVSVIVRNVPSRGTVAVVGDLFLHASGVMNPQMWESSAWNIQTGKQNRNKVICAADYIVPGHGPMFQVTTEMKNMAACSISGNNPVSGQMMMYPGSNMALQCFSNANCASFAGYANCVRSTRMSHNVCCSTTSCP